jgi:type VI secretion system VasD/TssJ family lipoprotein
MLEAGFIKKSTEILVRGMTLHIVHPIPVLFQERKISNSNTLITTLLILVFVFISAASCKKVVPPPEIWPFEKKGVKIVFRADENLNLYEGEAHTLAVCCYQLSKPNAFHALKKNKEGILDLLKCTRFDDSVASSEKIIIQPGDRKTVLLDRAEDARLVGIVAGYYNIWPNHVIRTELIPIEIERKGVINRKEVAYPGQLSLELFLGPEEIMETGEKN